MSVTLWRAFLYAAREVTFYMCKNQSGLSWSGHSGPINQMFSTSLNMNLLKALLGPKLH